MENQQGTKIIHLIDKNGNLVKEMCTYLGLDMEEEFYDKEFDKDFKVINVTDTHIYACEVSEEVEFNLSAVNLNGEDILKGFENTKKQIEEDNSETITFSKKYILDIVKMKMRVVELHPSRLDLKTTEIFTILELLEYHEDSEFRKEVADLYHSELRRIAKGTR